MPVIFADGIPAIRQQARFLHNAKMNFFAPDQGPPPALLARLEAAPIGSLPLCHGWLDQATAIDDGAFLLNGWLTDPQTRHTADYIAIRDRTGKILATAPALEERIDLIAPLGIKPPSLGFIAGARDNSADTHFVRLAGLFPGKTRELCEWPTLVTINGLQLQPLEELHNPHAGPASTFSFANGFHADAGRLNSTPQISASLQVASSDGGTPQQPHRLVITLDLTKPSTEALALPVLASGIARQKSADFIMRDGTDLRISLDPWWNWKGWHSVVLPLAVRQSHGDVARIEITDAGEGAITIGAPMLAAANPGWSKLF